MCGKVNKLAFEAICPYLKSTKGSGVAVCECARFKFPDNQTKREVLYGYCGHPTQWQVCTFKRVLDNYYERKFAGEKLGKNHRNALFE